MTIFYRRNIVTQETAGEYLRKIRRAQDLTLQDIATQTKVRVEYLLALEKGYYDQIPGEIYLKRFILAYSRALGVAPHKVLSRYHQSRIASTQNKNVFVTADISKKYFWQSLGGPRLWSSLGVVLVFLGVVSYLSWSVWQISVLPDLELWSPSTDLVLTEYQIEVSGKSSQGTRTYINEREVRLNEAGVFLELVQLKEGLNLLEIVASNDQQKSTKIIRQILVTGDSSLPETDFLSLR